jgi:outer membrane lipoprotein-sorting protein
MRSPVPRGGAAARVFPILVALAATGTAAAQAPAQSAPAKPAAPPASAPAAAPTPTSQQLAAGKALFGKVIDALGGPAKVRGIKDVQTRGQVTAKTPDGEMTMDIQTAMVFPDKLSQQLDAPFGRMAMVATPTGAWVLGPNGSSDLPPQMRDELLKQVQRVPLWLGQKTEDPKLSAAAMGTEKIGDVDASILDVRYENMAVRWYVHPTTYRILRSYHQALGPNGNTVKISSDYSDYRQESGFPVAHKLEVTTDGERDQTLTLEECKINAGVDPKLFHKPPPPTPAPTAPPAEPPAKPGGR